MIIALIFRLCYYFPMNKELYDLSYEIKKEFRQKIFSFTLFFLTVIILINLILHFLVFPVRQKSLSMQPDFPVNSCTFFSPLKKNFKRGDVVLVSPGNKDSISTARTVFDYVVLFFTANQVKPSNTGKWMSNENQIRRIIAGPGDSVYMRDYVLYIKPEGQDYYLTEFELVSRPYNISINASPAFWDNSLGVKGSFEPVELAKDEYFVFGDVRNSSVDSRFWGPVSSKDIKAGALFEYFPLNKIHLYF